MEIHFIRHTTPQIAPGVCYGQADIDVTDSFKEESNQILSALQQTKSLCEYDYIFTSPAKRCLLLAEKINQNQKTPIELSIHSELQEINFGDWELRAWEDIPRLETQPWTDDFIHSRPPQGESLLEMQTRVDDFLKEIFSLEIKYAAVCTHAGVMRLIAAKYLKIPLAEIFNIEISYGQILIVTKQFKTLSARIAPKQALI